VVGIGRGSDRLIAATIDMTGLERLRLARY
jgi:hypothetical protein